MSRRGGRWRRDVAVPPSPFRRSRALLATPARLVALLAVGLLLDACATAPEPSPSSFRTGGALEARHRVMRRLRGAPEPPLTALYRGVVRVGSGSHCRMYPSDSQLHDIRARECGATGAAALAIARLYLEVAAGPDLLQPVIAEDHLRWQHLPPAGSCVP
jgi:hypothetical protein